MPADRIRLKDISRLTGDAVVAMTDLVEAMHSTITRPVQTTPVKSRRTQGITGLVYQSIRNITSITGRSAQLVLSQLDAMIDTETPSPAQRHIRAALNGVIGDYLYAQNSPLAIPMTLRQNGHVLSDDQLDVLRQDTDTPLAVFVHGLCMHDQHWQRNGFNYPQRLRDRLNLRTLDLHYNTGRSIHDNGDELCDLLHRLFPVAADTPPLILIGHSMGGLLARRACYCAQKDHHPWLHQLDSIVTLGTPHLGAPLEQAGAILEGLMDKTPYSAPFAHLARLRSQGIKDLRNGRIVGADPRPYQPDPLKLPNGVELLAIAASLSAGRGDGLVPMNSALGEHREDKKSLAISESGKYRVQPCGHLDLLGHSAVEQRLVEWLSHRPMQKNRPLPKINIDSQ